MRAPILAALSIVIAAGAFAQSAEDVAALTAAVANPQTTDRIEAQFALGRAYELWAQNDPEHREQHLTDALTAYAPLYAPAGAMWRADSEAAARNNCGQIHLALGNDSQAGEFFATASALDVPMRSFYLANFAAFLAKHGDKSAAIEKYQEALQLQPDDDASRANLLELSDGPAAAAYLWQLAAANDLERAQRLALDNLGRKGEADRELLSIIAFTLARQHASAAAFGPISARLDAFLENRVLRDGIVSLRRLYEGATFERDAYEWWMKEVGERTAPAMQPAGAFSALACELGNQARAASAERAERYYKLAVAVTADRDPDPFVALADLYFDTGRTEEFKSYFAGKRLQLMALKGASLRGGDLRSVYRLHVALGTIYSKLGSDAEDVERTTYHLEHAQQTARELSVSTKTSVVLDPRSVELLAKSYDTTDRKSDARKLRLDSAEEYVRAGKVTSAGKVLDPVAPDALQGDEKIRYQQLRTQVPLSETPVQVPHADPNASKVNEIVQPPKVEVRFNRNTRRLDAATITHLQQLLEDYYSAPQFMKPDLEEKLKGFGVKNLKAPIDGKGALQLEEKGKTITLDFTVASKQ